VFALEFFFKVLAFATPFLGTILKKQ